MQAKIPNNSKSPTSSPKDKDVKNKKKTILMYKNASSPHTKVKNIATESFLK